MGFTGFYWVSFGLIRFHMTWLDLTEFYWVLLGFNGVDCMKIDIGSGFIGFHWVLPSFHRDEQVLLDIAGLRLGSNWLDCVFFFTEFYWVFPGPDWDLVSGLAGLLGSERDGHLAGGFRSSEASRSETAREKKTKPNKKKQKKTTKRNRWRPQ